MPAPATLTQPRPLDRLPGPRWGLPTTLSVIRDPLRCYRQLFTRYGDPVALPTLNGPLIATARPEHVEEILSASPEIYDPFATSALEGVLGAGSLLVLKGERHKQERKPMMSAFQGERMRAYAATVLEAVARCTRDWQPGTTLTGHDLGTAVTLEVIVRAIFGVDDGDQVVAMRERIAAIMEAALPLFFFSPRAQVAPLGLGPWARFERLKRAFDEVAFAQIAARRADPGHDILSALIAAMPESSDQALRDNLVTLVVAGHETTALVVAWALYHLHRHRDTLEALRAELDAHRGAEPDALTKLPYMRAVCYEAMRLHPVVPDFLRSLNQDVEMMGIHIPAGHGLAVATVHMHHDPAIYPEPERFKPERFLDSRPPKWAYLPFGGGHRRCVGAAFATYELALVLAEIVGRYDLELLEPKPVRPVRRNLTMAPSSPVHLRVAAVRSS